VLVHFCYNFFLLPPRQQQDIADRELRDELAFIRENPEYPPERL
jgi:hypothetical protein